MKKVVLFALFICLLIPLSILGQNETAQLPKEKSGEISPPTGKIAFIRNGNLWVMEWDGKNQFKVVTAENAIGKISWAPDGKRIAFCRKGSVDLRGPDNLGGKHKVYDIFIGYPDSAKSTTNWWRRVTNELGARLPEWSADGQKIIFTKDLSANLVNAFKPNYQTCYIDPGGGSFEIIRKDWQDTTYLSLMPTMGPNNMYAFVLYKNYNPIGMAIASLDMPTLSSTDIRDKVKILPKATAPAWSPDGKWIAYINNEASNQGIYITSPDLKENYLVYKPRIGQTLQTYPLSWASNSKWITFATGDGAIWVINLTGDGLKQVCSPGMNEAPAWSRK